MRTNVNDPHCTQRYPRLEAVLSITGKVLVTRSIYLHCELCYLLSSSSWLSMVNRLSV